MKTRSIARGIVGSVAALLGVMAAGCSADVAPGSEAEIGSAAEPLTLVGSKDSIDVQNTAKARAFAASCVLHDSTGNKDYLMIAGGLSAAGTVTNDVFLLDPTKAANAQWLTKTTFTTGRSHAKAIQNPGNSGQCIMTGGLDGSGNAITSNPTVRVSIVNTLGVISLSVDDSAAHLDTGTDKFEPRGKFELLPCGSKIIAIGGVNAGSTPLAGGSSTPTVQIWKDNGNSSFWTNATHDVMGTATLTDLGVPRFDMGAVKDPSANNYMVAGGALSSGRTGRIEFLKVGTTGTDTCDPAKVTRTLLADANGTRLSSPIEGNKLIPEGTTDTFLSVAGYDGSAIPTATEALSVTWSTPTASVAAGSVSLPTGGAHLPSLVFVPQSSTSHRYLLVGGDDPSSSNAAIGRVQEFIIDPTSSATGSFSTALTTLTARVGAAAEYLPSQHQTSPSVKDFAYVAGGFSSPSTYLSSTQEISTP